MAATYKLLIRQGEKIHEVDYWPNGGVLAQFHGYISTFAQLEKEVEKEFNCEELGLHSINSQGEQQEIKGDNDLNQVLAALTTGVTLSLAVYTKVESALAKERQLNQCLVEKISHLHREWLSTVFYEDFEQFERNSLDQEILDNQHRGPAKIITPSDRADEFYYRGALPRAWSLANNEVSGRPRMETLAKLLVSEFLEETIARLPEPTRSKPESLKLLRNIIDIQGCRIALTRGISPLLIQKLDEIEGLILKAISKEITRILASIVQEWDSLGYMDKTSEIVLNPRRASELCVSARGGLELLGDGIIPDEPQITGVSLELNPGVFRPAWVECAIFN